MDKVMEILRGLRPDVDFTAEKALIDGGVLSSFDLLNLVEELSDAFDIDIETDDIVPAHFNSAEGIYGLIQRILAGERGI